MCSQRGRRGMPIPPTCIGNNQQPICVDDHNSGHYPDSLTMMPPVGYCQHSSMLPPNHHCTCKEYNQNYYLQSHSRRPPGTLNPAIGIPLSICTAGLSCAAMGIYRGVKEHQARKRHLKAQKEGPETKFKKEMDQKESTPAAALPVHTYIRPSTVSQMPEMPGDGFAGGNPTPLPPSSADETTHHPTSPDSSILSPTYSELSSSSTTRSSSGSFRKVGTVSEIDSTPIEPPPGYFEKS